MLGTHRTNAGHNYLTENEEKRLFSYVSRLKDQLAERDLALMKTMRILGLRRVETVRLDVGDVFRKEKLVINERIAAKGAVDVLDIPIELSKVYARLFFLKRQWGEDMTDDAPLFVSRNGERLSIRAVNDLVKKWCAAAGVSITPHGFRHTKGRRIMDDVRHMTPEMERKRLNLAQKQLRHKTINATAIYTAPTKEEMALVAGI
jgi:integrase